MTFSYILYICLQRGDGEWNTYEKQTQGGIVERITAEKGFAKALTTTMDVKQGPGCANWFPDLSLHFLDLVIKFRTAQTFPVTWYTNDGRKCWQDNYQWEKPKNDQFSGQPARQQFFYHIQRKSVFVSEYSPELIWCSVVGKC